MEENYLETIWSAVSGITAWVRLLWLAGFTENKLNKLLEIDDDFRRLAFKEQKLHGQWLLENMPKNHTEALKIFPEAKDIVETKLRNSKQQRFGRELIAQAESADILKIIGAYLNLRKSGSDRFLARCPFHDDKNPSLVVYVKTQSFYCFGCGAGGGVIKFLMEMEGLSFKEAVISLAKFNSNQK